MMKDLQRLEENYQLDEAPLEICLSGARRDRFPFKGTSRKFITRALRVDRKAVPQALNSNQLSHPRIIHNEFPPIVMETSSEKRTGFYSHTYDLQDPIHENEQPVLHDDIYLVLEQKAEIQNGSSRFGTVSWLLKQLRTESIGTRT